MTSKSFPRAYASVSVISGSSSTTSRLGLALSGMGFDAFQKGAFQGRFLVLLAKPTGCAGVGECSVVQDGELVANLLDVGERVRREQYRSPLGPQLEQQPLGARACQRIEPAHRFVQNVQIAPRQKAGGETQLLRHTLGVIPDRLVQRGEVQIERREHRAHVLLLVTVPEQLEHHCNEFTAGEKVRSDEAFGEKREAIARLRAAVLDAVNFDRSRV